ncbi:uncharacterized protein [Haliotis asinina]|uniref:uncharacterized protein n=1 Tax=Haliotis asinina TaxID=109174 RepID=UPI0035321B0D
MVEYGVAVAWMVLSPVALLTCVVAVVVIAHYRPYFHGTDLCLMSLLACLMANVLLLIPIPGVMTLRGIPWSQPLCYCYIWFSVTIRVAEILSVLCMCVHWMTMLRLPSGKQVYGSTKAVKVYVVIMWLLATVIGIMPIIGATDDGYSSKKGTCVFLPHDLGVSFALFFIILNLGSIVLCLICTSDTLVLLRYMRRVAVVKYQAGRFYLPSTSAVAKTGSQTVHARYNELTFSSDLSRLVLAVVIATAAINHLPFTLIEFGQLVENPNTELVQTVVQWLLLMQSLTLPHALWLISKRYRHALIYTWKVYFLRDSAAEEEDPSACTLQSYTRKVRDVDGQTVRVAARVPGRQTAVVTDRGNSNHVANGQAVRANGNVIQGAVNHVQGDNSNDSMLEIQTTDLDDGMVIMTNSSKYVGSHDVTSRQSDSGRNSMRESSPASPSKSLLSTPVRGDDLRRTASSSSRVEWKEQMRRKHLPAIFVNEAFDGDEVPTENKLASPKRTEPRDKRKTGSDVSLYYMSSDYHHDSLTDNMPRLRHQESESEGASNAYGDDDIDNILDTQHTAVADTSMSMDMNEAFDEMLIGVTSDCKGLDELSKESTTDPDHHDSGHASVGNVTVSVVEHHEEPWTPGSDRSITLEPYREERRPPWMDEDDLSPRSALGDNAQQAHLGSPDDSNNVQFGKDIDKGFEEALALNYASGYGPGGLGLCFESIREEPEDTVSEDAVEAAVVADTVFKTQAVVSSGSSSRASSISDRPGLDDSRSDTVPINGIAEPIAEEGSDEELGQYEKNYKGPLTSFGRFYNNSTTENVNGLTPFRTFGYSEDGPPASPHYNANSVDQHVFKNNNDIENHGNQEHLKPVEHIDHNDSFYSEHEPSVARQRFTFSEANGQIGTDDRTYYFDGKDGAWSKSDMPSPKPAIQSLGPWPENEDDLQDFDMSFDSDFSEVSTSNSQPDVSKPQVKGVVTSTLSSHAVNGEPPETEKNTAFF